MRVPVASSKVCPIGLRSIIVFCARQGLAPAAWSAHAVASASFSTSALSDMTLYAPATLNTMHRNDTAVLRPRFIAASVPEDAIVDPNPMAVRCGKGMLVGLAVLLAAAGAAADPPPKGTPPRPSASRG